MALNGLAYGDPGYKYPSQPLSDNINNGDPGQSLWNSMPVGAVAAATGKPLNAEQISREKWERFQAFGQPIEDEYMAGLFDPAARESQATESRGLVRGQFQNSSRALDQTNARYGQPSADMADFQARRMQIERALSETEAGNTTRGLVRDRDMEGGYAMSAMGRGLSAQVGQTASQLGQMEAARKQQAAAASAQRTQSIMGLGGTALGIGLAAAFI